MAATGKTPILLYGSTTPTNAPAAGNLTNSSDGCEIAINVADKNLFFKDATNTVNTVPIRQSSASSDGWLSSADWSTFNSKQPAGTYVTSVTGTAPVVSSGGTTPAISMAAATGSVNGYLTSTDWSTFNGKQAALVSGTNIKTVSGTTLLGSGDLGTIGTGYGGTGLTSFTANGVLYATSTSALTTGTALNFDGTNLSVGTTTVLNYSSKLRVYAASNGSVAEFYTPGNNYLSRINLTTDWAGAAVGSFKGELVFYANDATTDRGRFDSNGNLKIENGNLIIGTSGKGIDFSATAGTGTSELLADYEEGTWTGTLTAATPPTTPPTATGYYTKIGRQVTVLIDFSNKNTSGGSGAMSVTGLPYTCGQTGYGPTMKNSMGTNVITAGVYAGNTNVDFSDAANMTNFNIVATTGVYLRFMATYFV